jgi:hypothetical protein
MESSIELWWAKKQERHTPKKRFMHMNLRTLTPVRSGALTRTSVPRTRNGTWEQSPQRDGSLSGLQVKSSAPATRRPTRPARRAMLGSFHTARAVPCLSPADSWSIHGSFSSCYPPCITIEIPVDKVLPFAMERLSSTVLYFLVTQLRKPTMKNGVWAEICLWN